MKSEEIAILLNAATTSGSLSIEIFNQFLTVVFGSLAFSAAVSLRFVSKLRRLGPFRCSDSSLLIAGALSSYFVISFLSFHKMSSKARTLLKELYGQLKSFGWKLNDETALDAFKPGDPICCGFELSSMGFIIGAVATIIAFLWISNTERNPENRT